MITPDPELQRKALQLRDAFRVTVWEKFKASFYNPSYPEILNTLHANYYSMWRYHKVGEMDFFQLKDLAEKQGLTVEVLLANRKRYYGLEPNEHQEK